ncbi:MAG TPA: winged helix-turn-helix domain-containing protein [Polyangiaceae bacterium]|nr:winged helix-turn-helix domain-containing protein [Polyangiaceae bacterium]
MKTSSIRITIGDRLRSERRSSFVGRERELERLLSSLDDEHALVTFVLGLGGIGKTRLLSAFAERLDERGTPHRVLDCESAPPTPAGFLGALGELLGRTLPSVRSAAEALSALGSQAVLALDQYEKFRLLDGWLRQELLPELPSSVHVFLFARDAAVDVWTGSPGWAALVQTLRLGPLDETSALAFLERRGVAPPARAELARLTAGHPLALELSARALAQRPNATFSSLETQQLIEQLAPLFLRTVDDEGLRTLLEAASVTRRATKSILATMVPEVFDEPRFAALQSLPFVEEASDGLVIHETVRSALAGSLRALDPRRYQELRGRAWSCLREELAGAAKQQLWRYMADMLYLVDRPGIREAFFPSQSKIYCLEAARPTDAAAVLELVRTHDADDLENMALWWQLLPDAFRVVRDGSGRVLAFVALALARDIPAELRARDPLLAVWNADVRDAAIPAETPVLFSRRALVEGTGEGPSPLRLALWLDAKRTYLEHPDARRIYSAKRNPNELLPTLAPLGFKAPESVQIPCGDTPLGSLVLDFGPRGVLGWLAGLIDAQFDSGPLDEKARALLVDGRRVPLTKLEFGVIRYLHDRKDHVVPRDDLLRHVWHQNYGGSNVVDAVVKSLRKKLGARSGLIETVTGHGYRLSDIAFRAK